MLLKAAIHSPSTSSNACRSIVSGVTFAGAPLRFCAAQYCWKPGMAPGWLIPGVRWRSFCFSLSTGLGVGVGVLGPDAPHGRQLTHLPRPPGLSCTDGAGLEDRGEIEAETDLAG